LDNNSKYEILLSDIKDYAIIPLITGGMLLLTLPILSGALLMVLADLHSNTLFFDPIFGGVFNEQVVKVSDRYSQGLTAAIPLTTRRRA
jgi:hypothetical protein